MVGGWGGARSWLEPEHGNEAERCDAQLNISFYGRALCSVAHGQSKRSAKAGLILLSRSSVNQIPLRSRSDITFLQ